MIYMATRSSLRAFEVSRKISSKSLNISYDYGNSFVLCFVNYTQGSFVKRFQTPMQKNYIHTLSFVLSPQIKYTFNWPFHLNLRSSKQHFIFYFQIMQTTFELTESNEERIQEFRHPREYTLTTSKVLPMGTRIILGSLKITDVSLTILYREQI